LTDLGRQLDVGGALDPGPQYAVRLPEPVPETVEQAQLLYDQTRAAAAALAGMPKEHPVRRSADDSTQNQLWTGILAKIGRTPYENRNATETVTAFVNQLDEKIGADTVAADLHKWTGGRLTSKELLAVRDKINQVRASRARYTDSQTVAGRLNARDAEREENDARAAKAASDRWSPEERAVATADTEHRAAKRKQVEEDTKDSWRTHLSAQLDAQEANEPKPNKALVDTDNKAHIAAAAIAQGDSPDNYEFTAQANRQMQEQAEKEVSGESGW